jgi:hypothetical protein
VVSALVVVLFHKLEGSSEFVSLRSLTDTLLTCWVAIVAVYLGLYYQHYKRAKPRRQLVAELIAYPFQWRDMAEARGAGGPGLSWFSEDMEAEGMRSIPGFDKSPWQQHRLNQTTGTAAAGTGRQELPLVEDVRGEALSLTLLRHYRMRSDCAAGS